MSLHVLGRHEETPCAAIERIEVEIDCDEGGALRLQYRMTGDADRILTGARGEPHGRRDGLWRHTCCELFVRDAAGPGYLEFNFAPCGDWAAYRFSAYRAGRARLAASPPRIELERSPTVLSLTATLTDQPFVALAARHIGIACIVETYTERSYWALSHPRGRPDFHHACSFASPHAIERDASSAIDAHVT